MSLFPKCLRILTVQSQTRGSRTQKPRNVGSKMGNETLVKLSQPRCSACEQTPLDDTSGVESFAVISSFRADGPRMHSPLLHAQAPGSRSSVWVNIPPVSEHPGISAA